MFVSCLQNSTFLAVVGEVAENKVAEMFPKALQNMLNILVSQNGMRSWQVYSDFQGVSCRIRFGHCDSVASIESAGSEAGHTATTTHIAYCRKPPAQVRRDKHRRIAKAKRPRIESDSEVENERKNEIGDKSENRPDTPIQISCNPPADETIIMTPLSPIKVEYQEDTHKVEHGDDLVECDGIAPLEPADIQLRISPVPPFDINFENDVSCELAYATDLIMDDESEASVVEKDSGTNVLCPNCDATMESVTHICSNDTDDELVETTKVDGESELLRIPAKGVFGGFYFKLKPRHPP